MSTIFLGREAHYFDPVSAGRIFTDIDEVSLAEWLRDSAARLYESKEFGGLSWWTGDYSAEEKYLTEKGWKAFEINSWYGFAGWDLALKVEQSPGVVAKHEFDNRDFESWPRDCSGCGGDRPTPAF